jgi:hypothetical protein
LLGLADELSRGIVVEWLDPADVAHLDSAYNNHEKSEVFRSLLSSPLTLFDVSYEGEENLRWFRWAMKRRLHLGSIKGDSSVPEDVWRSIALTSCSCLDRLRVLDIDDSDVSDALLLPLLKKCRNSLKEVKFRRCDRITEASAAPIGECSELEVLHPNYEVTSRLSEIVRGLPKLRECDFSDSSSLTDEGVTDLAMSCPGLEILYLHQSDSISDAAIVILLQHSRVLKELDLSINSQLTDAAFTGLSEGCWQKMEVLNLDALRLPSETSFLSLARACPSLVVVDWSQTNVTDEAVCQLCQLCPSILELYITDCPNVTDRSLVAISEHLPSVTVLDCAGNEAITDDGIEKLVAKCHSIETLWISGCPSISDKSMLQIADHCPALEGLYLLSNDRITAVSLGVLGAKCLKLKRVFANDLTLVTRENWVSLRLHFPHIDWIARDEDYDEEEEDQEEEEQEEEEL